MPRPHMGKHHTASTLALDAAESMDIADSRDRSPVRSLPSTRESSIYSTFGDESVLTLKIPGKDPVKDDRAQQAAENAYRKAERLSRHLNRHSAQGSMTTSTSRSPSRSRSSSSGPSMRTPLDLNNIPLRKLKRRKNYSIEDDADENEGDVDERDRPVSLNWWKSSIRAVKNYLRGSKAQEDSQEDLHELRRVKAHDPPLPSGEVTPVHERYSGSHIPRMREGFLAASLRLYSPLSPLSSGTSTPTPKHEKPYYKSEQSHSTSSVSNLILSSTVLAQPAISGPGEYYFPISPRRTFRSRSTGALDALFRNRRKKIDKQSVRIQVHIAETLSRQRYLVKLCRALMTYGAPTHRLEECLRLSGRALEIQSQFFYVPTCMIIAFDDEATHTSEIKLVRAPSGLDLSKLKDTYHIYKDVLNDRIGVDVAIPRLDDVMQREPRYGRWLLIFMYGLSSASVAPFAFRAQLIDLPIAFLLGILVGVLQLILVPRADVYVNVSEVTIAIVTSFFSRFFGSIRGGQVFCFSALAQSSIVLILPGYTLLCGSLELQAKSFVAGSVRIVYVLIYSLFLGFGTTIGTALYGACDRKAISSTSCKNPMPVPVTWVFVPIFTGCIVIINQGRARQIEIMILIAFVGYIVNHYANIYLHNIQAAQAVGALAVGVMANLYSRFNHGPAVAAILPAIYVQVPSALAAGASLISGVGNADEITGNGANTAVTKTEHVGSVQIEGKKEYVFTVVYSMIQIAIGITVGLFFSSLIVNIRGNRRSVVFSF